MRIVFLIIVFLHALIHLLGFVKAFTIADIKELRLPISKPAGIVWLVAAAMLILFAFLYLTDQRQAWIVGLLAVIISQVLTIFFWQDAKFATLPNLIILGAVIL